MLTLPHSPAAHIEPGTGTGCGMRLVTRAHPSLDYFLYLPEGYMYSGRILVSVHGISRNAQEHIELMSAFADRYGVVLVAPLFDAEVFSDYQRLGRKGAGPRADLALIRMLNEIGMRTGLDTSQVDMFGFSGGAQFAHRFAYAHSQRVRSLVLGSAGWYTMPNDSLSYPYGSADAKGLDAVRLNCVAAARLPILVMVGECDDREDDDELNRSSVVQKTQGRHRLQRAQSWTAAMNALARRHGASGSIEMVVLPEVGHSFSQAVMQGGMAQRVFEYCYKRPTFDPVQCADLEAAFSDRHSRGDFAWQG